MKTSAVTTMLLLSFGIMIFSFQKPVKSARRIAPGMYALVNNKPWVAQVYSAGIATDPERGHFFIVEPCLGCLNEDTTPKRILAIVGVNTSSAPYTEFFIRIPYFNDAGVYKIDYSSVSSARAYYSGQNQNSEASSGTITIYQVSDSNVQGVFNFVTDSGVTVKNGTFNVNFNSVR